MGGTWGVEIIDDRVLEGAPLLGKDGDVIGHEMVHVIRINLRHPTGAVPGYGQTMLVGSNKNGIYTDEEAPKKSLTDALTKALSWLGFAADIHMGRWDDNKYVNAAKQGFAGDAPTPETPEPDPPPPPPPPAPRGFLKQREREDWAASIAAASDGHSLADVKIGALTAASEARDESAYNAFRALVTKRALELTQPKAKA